MTPQQRGRVGGLARSAMYDGREMTAKARRAFRDRFLEQVDPSGELRRSDPAEALRRAEAARKLFFVRMAYKSAQIRACKKSS
jgi:hypothetical protein